jgi:hypothetical protein
VHVVGRQQAEAAVAVVRVVSGEEDPAVEPGRASWIEPNPSGNPGRYFIEQADLSKIKSLVLQGDEAIEF